MPTRKIGVWLGEAVKKIQGDKNWQKEDNGELWDSHGIDDEAILVIHFPSGLEFKDYSKITFMKQKKGIVYNVITTPLADTESYDLTLKKARSIAEQLKISKANPFWTKLDDWKKNPPKGNPFFFVSKRSGCELEKNVELILDVKPQDDTGLKWYVSCDFTYTKE